MNKRFTSARAVTVLHSARFEPRPCHRLSWLRSTWDTLTPVISRRYLREYIKTSLQISKIEKKNCDKHKIIYLDLATDLHVRTPTHIGEREKKKVRYYWFVILKITMSIFRILNNCKTQCFANWVCFTICSTIIKLFFFKLSSLRH
jgi:hypothetical protein